MSLRIYETSLFAVSGRIRYMKSHDKAVKTARIIKPHP
jgi:hypothetical protein